MSYTRDDLRRGLKAIRTQKGMSPSALRNRVNKISGRRLVQATIDSSETQTLPSWEVFVFWLHACECSFSGFESAMQGRNAIGPAVSLVASYRISGAIFEIRLSTGKSKSRFAHDVYDGLFMGETHKQAIEKFRRLESGDLAPYVFLVAQILSVAGMRFSDLDNIFHKLERERW